MRWVTYLLIVDNPWESPQDRADTLELVSSLPQLATISLYSLTFHPGIPLYERALSEKLIRGDATDAAYWRSFKTLEPTPGNETLSLMQLLPLSSTAASRLARWGFSQDGQASAARPGHGHSRAYPVCSNRRSVTRSICPCRDEGAIQDMAYLTPEQLGRTSGDRKAIFDIYCENTQGEKFIVEMQKAK